MRTILTILLIALSISVYPQRPILKMLFENNAVDSSMYSVAGGTSGTVAYNSTYKAQGTYSLRPGYLGQWESTNNFNTGTAFYVSAWVRTSTSEDNRTIIGNYPEGGEPGWYLALNGSTNTVYFKTQTGGSSNSVITNTNSWTDNVWTNIGVWVDRANGKARIYINGVKQTLASNDSLIRTDFPYNTNPISINGYLDGGQGFNDNGYIDNVQIYNYLLNQSQIDSLVDRVNDSPAFELGRAGSTPPMYSPVAGKHTQPTYKGVLLKPTHAGLDYYWKLKGSPYSITDTIQYYLSEDFESWSNATVQNKDSISKRLPSSLWNYTGSQHTIVDVGGDNGNMWQWFMPEDLRQGLQWMVHLGDTATELYYQYDLMVQSDFNNIAKNGIGSGKLPGGFAASNRIGGIDTITTAGFGSRIHSVWGMSPNMMLYIYDQYHLDDAEACGACGQWAIPKGYVQTNTIRVNVGHPGQDDGFAEKYINGVKVAEYTGVKSRSLTQGEDFGKIEAIYNSYQFGGGDAYLCPQDQWIRIDNIVVYQLKPGANSYVSGVAPSGARVPIIDITEKVIPEFLVQNETYVRSSDTIYDVGNGKHYIYNPENKKETVYKTVTRPSGSISFEFITKEFGYDDSGYPYHVDVYSGSVAPENLEYEFGYSADGYTYPSGSYTVTNSTVIFAITIGTRPYDTRGTAIRYWQP